MITQSHIFIGQGINIRWFFLAGTGPGMLKHSFYDRIGAFTVMIDFLFIIQNIVAANFIFSYRVSRDSLFYVPPFEFFDEFDIHGGKIIYKIQRILDLMRNARGQFTQRGHFLPLNKLCLCGLKFILLRLDLNSFPVNVFGS